MRFLRVQQKTALLRFPTVQKLTYTTAVLEIVENSSGQTLRRQQTHWCKSSQLHWSTKVTANKTCSIFAPELQRRFEYVFENILQVSLVESGLEFSDLGINKEENSTFLVTFQVLGLKEEFGHGNGEPLDYSKIEKLIFHASFRLGKRYGVYQYTLTTHASREMSCLHNASFPVDSSSNIFPNGTLYLNQTKSYYAKMISYATTKPSLPFVKDLNPRTAPSTTCWRTQVIGRYFLTDQFTTTRQTQFLCTENTPWLVPRFGCVWLSNKQMI